MTKNDAIAISELIIYIPILLLTLIVLFRHGFQKQLGWVYLLIFSIIRLAGSVFEILHTQTPSNTTYAEWAILLQSVGLSPLLLSSLGLLKRVIDGTSTHIPSRGGLGAGLVGNKGLLAKLAKRASADSRRSRVIQLLQLPCTIALILCISGGTNSSSATSSATSSPTVQSDTKWGVGIFIVVYIFLVGLALFSMCEIQKTRSGEKRILVVVVMALPLIGSRLLYSVICTFHSSQSFNVIDGNVAVRVSMALVEEALIVIMYVLVGLTVGKFGDGGLTGREREEVRMEERRKARRSERRRVWVETHGMGGQAVQYPEVQHLGGGYSTNGQRTHSSQ